MVVEFANRDMSTYPEGNIVEVRQRHCLSRATNSLTHLSPSVASTYDTASCAPRRLRDQAPRRPAHRLPNYHASRPIPGQIQGPAATVRHDRHRRGVAVGRAKCSVEVYQDGGSAGQGRRDKITACWRIAEGKRIAFKFTLGAFLTFIIWIDHGPERQGTAIPHASRSRESLLDSPVSSHSQL